MKWQSDSHRASCTDCIDHYETSKHELPPCEYGNECPFGKPVLFYNNALALELFNKIQNQIIIAGMGEPLGLDHNAIYNIMDIYCINDVYERQVMFDKILAIDCVRMTIRANQLKEEKKNKQGKNKSGMKPDE